MDKMSLFSIMTVSVPEAVLNIYVGFVLIGQRNRLYLDDKLNIIRLIASVILMVSTAVLSRSILPSLVLVLAVNILVYGVILKFIYSIRWSDAFLSVFCFFVVLITVESIYGFLFLAITNKYFLHFSQDLVRLLGSLPERVVQLFVIVSFWKWDLVYLSLRNNKKLLRIFALLAIVLLSAEAIFSYMYIFYFDSLALSFKIWGSIGCFLFGIANYILCKTIILLLDQSTTQ